MSLLWNRKAALIFGQIGQQAIRIEGLRISFNIEKTSESNPNKGNIIIYNLKEFNRSVFEKEKNVFVSIEIGYGNDMEQLFIGNVTKSISTRKGSDWITEIEAGDGHKAIKEGYLNKSYRAGTNVKEIAKDALNAMKDAGETIIGSIDVIKNEVAQNGLSVSGLASTVMDKLMPRQGLEWSIQDNKIQILEKNKSTNEEAILLSSDTGLVGTPKRREKGIEFTALIQTTKFRPGRKVKLETRNINGFYTLRKTIYKGDTHGNEWYVNCEAL